MKASLCVFLLLVLLSTATCLKCLLCLDDKETCLETTNQECKPEEDSCISGLSEILLGEEKVLTSFKACFQSKNCQTGYASTTFGNNTYIQSNVSCCKTDFCNGGAVQLPPKNTTLNGLRCPSCFSISSDHCHSNETVGCTYDEDRCIDFSSSVKTGEYNHTFALQGCATESTCATKVGVIEVANGAYVQNITRVDCSPAST